MAVRYDKIGSGYNSTRKADPYLTHKLVEHLSRLKMEPTWTLVAEPATTPLNLRKRDFR